MRFLSRSFVAALAVITACSSAPGSPGSPGSPRGPGAAGPGGPTNAGPATTTTWKAAMHEIGEHFEKIDKALHGQPSGDLDEAARRASRAAELLRTGYGRLEQKDIPGFAGFARDAESWFLQLELEAGQQHLDLARGLWVGAEARHCGRCHDAAERVRS